MIKRGFTLIEILVAVAIFTIIIGAVSGIFVSAVRAQRRSLSSQELLNQVSYVTEYMSRALRMVRKQTTGEISCLSLNGLNYEIPPFYQETADLGWGIKFINYEGTICQEFFWDKTTNRLMENRVNNPNYPLPLTSANLKVNSLKFKLSGQSQEDELQPRVTISLGIEGGEQSKIQIQTTISQRNLDVKY